MVPNNVSLGQMAYSRNIEEYELPDCAEHFFSIISVRLGQVISGIPDNSDFHHPEWLYEESPIAGMSWQSYWWGDEDAPEASHPNFSYDGVDISWYKYIRRGMTTNKNWTCDSWYVWMRDVLARIDGWDEEFGESYRSEVENGRD